MAPTGPTQARSEVQSPIACALSAAESECCAFLTFGLNDDPTGLRLTIAAPEGAEPVLSELVGAFVGELGRAR
jgi:hypothetical protein